MGSFCVDGAWIATPHPALVDAVLNLFCLQDPSVYMCMVVSVWGLGGAGGCVLWSVGGGGSGGRSGSGGCSLGVASVSSNCCVGVCSSVLSFVSCCVLLCLLSFSSFICSLSVVLYVSVLFARSSSLYLKLYLSLSLVGVLLAENLILISKIDI